MCNSPKSSFISLLIISFELGVSKIFLYNAQQISQRAVQSVSDENLSTIQRKKGNKKSGIKV